MSKCGKCNGMYFRLEEKEPSGSRVKWYFVQCASCGTPVGVVDYYPNGTVLQAIEALTKSLTALKSDVAGIDYLVRQLLNRA